MEYKWDTSLTTFVPKNLGRFVDITGLRVKKLVALYPTGSSSIGQVIWKFKCDCGSELDLIGAKVKARGVTSCGCGRYGSNAAHWTGYEEMPGKFWNIVVRSAEKRGHSFNITKEYMWNMFIAQDRKCALSGIPIQFMDKANIIEQTASIDRIDSTVGYEVGNVQWVHKDINKMKNTLDEEYFIYLCSKVQANKESHTCAS